MVKKWRSCLSLLVSFAFILSMLFLDTYEVKAAGPTPQSVSVTKSGTLHCTAYEDYVVGTISGGGGYITNGSGSIGAVHGSTSTHSYGTGVFHISVPFQVRFPWSGFDIGDVNQESYYLVTGYLPISISTSGHHTDQIVIANQKVTSAKGDLIWTLNNDNIYYSREVCNGSDIYDGNFVYCFNYEFDVSFDGGAAWAEPDIYMNYSVGGAISFYCWQTVKPSTPVTDTQANQHLTTIEQNEQSINDSVSNPSGGGILGTIKNFFGGFFGWLHDTILGLFVPSSDYFTTWFTNVNTLLSDKLGMLYAPLDLLISTLNAVYSASSDFTGIPFPEIKWGDTVLVSAQNLTFSNLLGEHFEDIQGYVYFGTDVVLLFAFLMLLQRKITLVLRGHESG